MSHRGCQRPLSPDAERPVTSSQAVYTADQGDGAVKGSRKVVFGVLGGTPLVSLLFATVLSGDLFGELFQILASLLIVALLIALVVWVVE